ncbi:type VII toxin-antitoxin system MntA family adenylyltransferase antitoxin [Persephonella sp.]
METLKQKNNATFYIQKIVEVIKKYNPEKIVLFGSRARGDNKRTSDIDIAVDIDLPFREQRKLKEEVDKISGLYSVDLIFLPNVNEKFKKKILKEGKTLYEKK